TSTGVDGPPDLRSLLRDFARPAGVHVDAGAGGDAREWLCGQELAGGAIDDVDVTVSIRVQEDLTERSVPRQIHQHIFVDAAIVEEVVRVQLIRPDGLTVPGISRKDG